MFKDVTTRYPELSNASLEVFIMLGIAFLLGFLFCYFQNKRED